MRSVPFLIGLLLLVPAAHASGPVGADAQAAAIRPAAKRPRLSVAKRNQLAVAAVRSSLDRWVKPGTQIDVRAAIVPFNGDPRNPITGRGPVEVFVSQQAEAKGFFRRLLARFNPYARQHYLVHVGDNGETAILERLSLAPHRRLARFIAEKLPLRALFLDFYRSDKAQEGMWTLAGASGSAAFSPALSAALFVRLAQVVHQGIKSQHEVRRQALEATATWARDSHEQSGQWPTLMEAYRAYKGELTTRGEARPLALGDFAEALSVRQL